MTGVIWMSLKAGQRFGVPDDAERVHGAAGPDTDAAQPLPGRGGGDGADQAGDRAGGAGRGGAADLMQDDAVRVERDDPGTGPAEVDSGGHLGWRAAHRAVVTLLP